MDESVTKGPDWAMALRARRALLGLSQQEVAAASADVVSQGTVSDLERGKVALEGLTARRLAAYARALGWSLGELQEASGVDLGLEAPVREAPLPRDLTGPTRRVPVFEAVSAGPGADDGVVVEEIDIPANWLGTYAGYRVSGESMEPDIAAGSIVVVRLQDHADLGQVVVAFVPGRGMVVKRLVAVTREQRLILSSRNPDYARLVAEDAHIIGVVREARKLFG